MRFLAAAGQMRELDRVAIEEGGIPALTLMEHAGLAVAETVRELVDPLNGSGPQDTAARIFAWRGKEEPDSGEQTKIERLCAAAESQNGGLTPRVAVFCGTGNNGGDGLAAARLLREMGYAVRVYLVGERRKMTPDASVMAARLERAGGELEEFRTALPDSSSQDQRMLIWLSTCDCIVDALFGVGLSRPVEGNYLTAVALINAQGCPVVACDVPSGVHADTGQVLGEAVYAKVTVTFTCGKPGLYLGQGAVRAGEIRVADIGIPTNLVHEKIFDGPKTVCALARGTYGLELPRRPRTAHKGDFGRVFILAGSVGYTGAPVLAASAAVRAGAGLVYLGVPREIWPVAAVKCDEAMPFPLPDAYGKILQRAGDCGVALLGPGLGRAPETQALVLRLLADLNIPVVLDADGLNALAGHLEVLDRRTAPTILTPHEGEFARLTRCPLPVLDRLEAARTFARTHRCILVLKGFGTVTAGPDGRAFINTTGNPGMARGGSGDALAGLLAGLLVQNPLRSFQPDLTQLTAQGVYYHGQAGDLAAGELGEYGMTVGDLIGRIPAVLREYTGER